MRIGARQTRRWFSVAATVIFLSIALATAAWPQPSTSHPAPFASDAKPYHLPPDKLEQAIVLGRVRTLIHFGSELWNVVFLFLLLFTGLATKVSRWSAARTPRPWLQCCIFSAVVVALVFLTVDLPVATIGHAFALHYHISVEQWTLWLVDQAKTFGLTLLLEVPLLLLVFGLMHWSWARRRYWLWFSAFAVPLTLLGTFLLPSLIEPLFDTFEPLTTSHPALANDLQRVVTRTGIRIPPERMFLMKASEKSNGLNAYVTGLGATKRIVVWDTTADRMPEDEILFTFAHETGHYVLNHIPKGLTLGSAGIFLILGVTAATANWMVGRWDTAWQVRELGSLPGLVVLLFALAIWQIVAEPIESTLSRHFEHEADVYGQEAIHGLVPDPQKTAVAAFNRLGEAYLDDPNPNPLIEFWSYDHPSIQNRAIFASQYDPWAPDRKPQFFSR